jgi:general stress protein CsbA
MPMKFITKKKGMIFIALFFPIMLILAYDMVNEMLQTRSTTSLFYDNGRFLITLQNVNYYTRNIRTILFGSGLAIDNYPYVIVHNWLMEFYFNLGAIVATSLIALIVVFFRAIKSSPYSIIVMNILMGSSFYANFYGNYFATAYFIVILLMIPEKHELNVQELESRVVYA